MALWHSSNTRHPSNSSPPHQFTSCCRRLCLLPLKTPTNQQTNHQFRVEYLMYLKIYAGIIIPLYWTDINLRYMYKNSLLIWLTCISDLQFHILIKYRRLKSTPPPLYKEKQNITFIPYIFVLWNYTWTVAYCGQSMPSDLTHVQCLWSNESFFTPDQNVQCLSVRFWALQFLLLSSNFFYCCQFLSFLLKSKLQ